MVEVVRDSNAGKSLEQAYAAGIRKQQEVAAKKAQAVGEGLADMPGCGIEIMFRGKPYKLCNQSLVDRLK